MKKMLFGLACLILALPNLSNAAGLPSSANLDYRVVNISMDNQDAESAGVRPGDVLRYELELRSATEDVVDYVAQIDVGSIADHVEFIEMGLGRKEGNFVVYEPYSHAAPCRQVWTFFVRFKGCEGNVGQLSTQVDGMSTMVPTTCDGAPVVTEEPPARLPSSGPTRLIILAFIAVGAIFGLGQMMIRRA